ncbi:MAG: DUF2207 domain-containing protein [Prevotella sp.]|nr:DUF2207 domain-containing protein [Prevotella sp.]
MVRRNFLTAMLVFVKGAAELTYALAWLMTKEIKTITLSLVLLLSATMAFAQSRLQDLDIRVVLTKNGDARITETRQMTIDKKGTECYIGLGNMSPSTVKDLTVSDETGHVYENIGEWDNDRSRSEKAGRCGMVKKSNGVIELCWGLGESGQRTYVTNYTITGLVRGYSDADALRHVFLDKSVKPKPERAKVTIVGADTTLVFTPGNCSIWGFRFKGDMQFEDGKLVAVTTEPMNAEAALYIMAKFPKGMLKPTIQITDDTFEHKRQLAFEGSDYGDAIEEEETSFWQVLLSILIAFGILAAGAAVLGGLYYLFKKVLATFRRKKHEKWTKTVDYFKSLPLEGNLQQTNDMLNAFAVGKDADYNRLISATILQLINEGVFGVQSVMTETGEMAKRFVVKKEDLSLEKDLPPLTYKMHDIFKKAAGEDHVLDPKELETFMKDKSNRKLLRSFMDLLCTKRDIKYYKDRKEEMCEVYGFKRFLDDFTLVNERHLTETQLWRDYLVWATLYGNAEQVKKDMKAINPEFFKMDQIASQLLDSTVLPVVYASVFQTTDRMLDERKENRRKNKNSSRRSKGSSSSRSSGKGGRSSWGGGGGGFSGEGGGGGIR